MNRKIKINCTKDNSSFEVDTDLISKSKFLNDLCQEYSNEEVIEIPDIDKDIFKLIIEWLTYAKNNTPNIPSAPLKSYLTNELFNEWEDKFFNKVYDNDFSKLFEFLNAVNFLDIPPLLEQTSAKTACLTKDLTPQEFKELFKIQEDCTEEDISKIEEEVLKEREEEQHRKQMLEQELEKEDLMINSNKNVK